MTPEETRNAWLEWQRNHQLQAAQIRAHFGDEAIKDWRKARDGLLLTIANRIDAPLSEVYAAIGQ